MSEDMRRFDSGRKTLEETVAALAQASGAEIVWGVGEIGEATGVVRCDTRPGGFHHGVAAEWYVPLQPGAALAWQSRPVPVHSGPTVAFYLPVGFGNGSPWPQAAGCWELAVNGHSALRVRVVRHAQLWQENGCTFAFAAAKAECAEPFASLSLNPVLREESFATWGPALLIVPAAWAPAGSPAVLSIKAAPDTPSTRWFGLVETTLTPLDDINVGRLAGVLNPAEARRIAGRRVWFGDVHTHSGEVPAGSGLPGCGSGTRASNYRYARGPGALDFYALTEHEYQIAPDAVDEYFALADHYQEAGRFICLPAYEHTNIVYGHRNVYFADSGGVMVNASREWTALTKDRSLALPPDELWQRLAESGRRCLTVPHHPSAAPHPMDWRYFNPAYDRLVEVYSIWGSSEYYGDYPRGDADRLDGLTVRDALNRGYRMGLIASSDGHDGHAGEAQGIGTRGPDYFSPLGSGWMACFGEQLSREGVYQAMHDRRCYGTTGVPILLWFSLNGAEMGAELPALPAGARPRLAIACRGANGLDHVRIVKNGRVVHTEFCHGEWETDLEWEDAGYMPETPAYYYVRVVQVDRQSAWSSPVWVG
jgi:hypothetical protein